MTYRPQNPSDRIGIIDADLLDGGTRHPNLALMKISRSCKLMGCSVDLLESYESIDDYDHVFVSKVFTFSKVPEDANLNNNPRVSLGGTGFFPDGGESLDYEIEHCMPDYSLYEQYVHKQINSGRKRSWFADYLDYSIGFTTRGCFRKCSFCVNKKYDHVFRHSPVSEFFDPQRRYIYLWDDNILAFSGWEEVFEELNATQHPFQFRQGLDLRLMTPKKAKVLSSSKYKGSYIFAFDHLEDRPIIEEKLALWRSYTSKDTRLYLLCAFDSQDAEDIAGLFERISVLMHYGCLPYVMRYESYKNSPWRGIYVNVARWCNQPQFFKKMSFREFCEANQRYHKNPNTLCAAFRSMKEFEIQYPEIASRYFDLKFAYEKGRKLEGAHGFAIHDARYR